MAGGPSQMGRFGRYRSRVKKIWNCSRPEVAPHRRLQHEQRKCHCHNAGAGHH